MLIKSRVIAFKSVILWRSHKSLEPNKLLTSLTDGKPTEANDLQFSSKHPFTKVKTNTQDIP